MAKRHGLGIDADSPPEEKETTTQFDRGLRRRETLAKDSKAGEDIETLVFQKLAKPMALAKLVKELSDEVAYKSDEIISKIMGLQADKKILIREPAPYIRFLDYLTSPISIWFWELVVATVASIGLVFASSGPALYVRYIFGSLSVLFLPGYSLVGFIYSKKDDLDSLTRFSVSFVMSLAMTTLVGLALSFTPFGITLFAVALSLSAVTTGLLLLTALRKYSYYRLVNFLRAE